jgi:hypothetical protein
VVDVKSYKVTARRSGSWWAFRADDVPGAVGQARRLEQVESEARDVLAMMLEVPDDVVEVELVVDLDDVTADEIRRARQARLTAELAAVAALLTMAVTVQSLRGKGLSIRDVADLLGVSYQRVSQIERQDVVQLENRKRELELRAAA